MNLTIKQKATIFDWLEANGVLNGEEIQLTAEPNPVEGTIEVNLIKGEDSGAVISFRSEEQ